MAKVQQYRPRTNLNVGNTGALIQGLRGISPSAVPQISMRALTANIPTLRPMQIKPQQHEQYFEKVDAAETANAMAKFSTALMNTGIQMVEEQAKLQASEEYFAAADELRVIKENYLMMSGGDGVEGHEGFKNKVEQVTQRYIEDASPLVQKHLLPMIMTERDQVLGIGAGHKLKSRQQWQQDVVAKNKQELNKQVADRMGDPEAALEFLEGSTTQMFAHLPAEQRVVAKQQVKDEILLNAFTDLVSNKPNGAVIGEQAYNTLAGDVSNTTRASMRQLIETQSNREWNDWMRERQKRDLARSDFADRLTDRYYTLKQAGQLGGFEQEIQKGFESGMLSGSDAIAFENMLERERSGDKGVKTTFQSFLDVSDYTDRYDGTWQQLGIDLEKQFSATVSQSDLEAMVNRKRALELAGRAEDYREIIGEVKDMFNAQYKAPGSERQMFSREKPGMMMPKDVTFMESTRTHLQGLLKEGKTYPEARNVVIQSVQDRFRAEQQVIETEQIRLRRIEEVKKKMEADYKVNYQAEMDRQLKEEIQQDKASLVIPGDEPPVFDLFRPATSIGVNIPLPR